MQDQTEPGQPEVNERHFPTHVVDPSRIVVVPSRGYRRVLYDHSGQNPNVTWAGGSQIPILNLERRLAQEEDPPRNLGWTIVIDGSKGGSTKSSTAANVAGANARAGNVTILIEATLEGSLTDFMGLERSHVSARTLFKSMNESVQCRDVRNSPETLIPSMTWGQFCSHTFRTDTGVRVLFQPYEDTVMPRDGSPVNPWYTPGRLYAVHAEAVAQGGDVLVDTGNEATTLKQATLSVADAFLATTTTDAAKITKTESCINRRLLQYGVPIVTVVTNEEGASMSRVLEVMARFMKYGPVRYVEYVPVIKRTGLTRYHMVPRGVQDQYDEVAATFRDLRVTGTTERVPQGKAFRSLRRQWEELTASQLEAVANEEAEETAEESVSEAGSDIPANAPEDHEVPVTKPVKTTPPVVPQASASSNGSAAPVDLPRPPVETTAADSQVLPQSAPVADESAIQAESTLSAPIEWDPPPSPGQPETAQQIAERVLGAEDIVLTERAVWSYVALLARRNPGVLRDEDDSAKYDADQLCIPQPV